MSECLIGTIISDQTKKSADMDTTRSLTYKLKPLLGWHQSRVECLAHIIINLIISGSVNLTTIAEHMGGDAKMASNYKRLKRFFSTFDLCLNQVAQLALAWLAPRDNWVLTIDRTNWKLGTSGINILMLGIEINGTAIPIVWTLLPKQGNSNTQERIELLNRFIRLFGQEKIAYLTADREFKGRKWLKYLRKNSIHWRIRIANNTQIPNTHFNRQLPATRLFCLRVGESMHLNKARTVWGVTVFVSAYRSAQEHIIIISDEPCENRLADYMRRWSIETLFQSYKGRGFKLEETRLTEPERLSRLLAVMVLAFCWCYNTGQWRQEKEPIKILKHGRPAQSVFRYGLSLLRHTLKNAMQKWREARYFIRQFCANVNPIPKCAEPKELMLTC